MTDTKHSPEKPKNTTQDVKEAIANAPEVVPPIDQVKNKWEWTISRVWRLAGESLGKDLDDKNYLAFSAKLAWWWLALAFGAYLLSETVKGVSGVVKSVSYSLGLSKEKSEISILSTLMKWAVVAWWVTALYHALKAAWFKLPAILDIYEKEGAEGLLKRAENKFENAAEGIKKYAEDTKNKAESWFEKKVNDVEEWAKDIGEKAVVVTAGAVWAKTALDSLSTKTPTLKRFIKKGSIWALLAAGTYFGIKQFIGRNDKEIADIEKELKADEEELKAEDILKIFQKYDQSLKEKFVELLKNYPKISENTVEGADAFNKRQKEYYAKVHEYAHLYEITIWAYNKFFSDNPRVIDEILADKSAMPIITSPAIDNKNFWEYKSKELASINKGWWFTYIEPSKLRKALLDKAENDEDTLMQIVWLLPVVGSTYDWVKQFQKWNYTESIKSFLWWTGEAILTIWTLGSWAVLLKLATNYPRIIALLSRASAPVRSLVRSLINKMPETIRNNEYIKKIMISTTIVGVSLYDWLDVSDSTTKKYN